MVRSDSRPIVNGSPSLDGVPLAAELDLQRPHRACTPSPARTSCCPRCTCTSMQTRSAAGRRPSTTIVGPSDDLQSARCRRRAASGSGRRPRRRRATPGRSTLAPSAERDAGSTSGVGTVAATIASSPDGAVVGRLRRCWSVPDSATRDADRHDHDDRRGDADDRPDARRDADRASVVARGIGAAGVGARRGRACGASTGARRGAAVVDARAAVGRRADPARPAPSRSPRCRRADDVPSSGAGDGRRRLRLDLLRRARTRGVVVAAAGAGAAASAAPRPCARRVRASRPRSSSSGAVRSRREVRHLDGRRRVAELELDALQRAGELDRARDSGRRGATAMPFASTAIEAARHVGPVDRRDRAALDATDEVERAVGPAGDLERRASGEQRVHGRREREHVAALVGPGVVLEHLGRRPGHAHADRRLAATPVAEASAGDVIGVHRAARPRGSTRCRSR